MRRFLLLLLAALFFACQIPPVITAPDDPAKWKDEYTQSYTTAGVKWMDSAKDEVIHFICPVDRKYVISLDTRSMIKAGIPANQHKVYLAALRAAALDWGKTMNCREFVVSLDAPYADTRIAFENIKYEHVLAYAYRAGNIKFDSKRKWFPGSRSEGHWGPKHEYSFYWIAAHELGHVWGLEHCGDLRSILYPSQAAEGRWSWYEKMAGRIMYLVRWHSLKSIAFRTKRFFVKTPLAEIHRLLAKYR